MKTQLHIGCSGFSYREWKGLFYPEKLPSSGQLAYYSSVFKTLELNSTFYHFPKAETLRKFYDSTPDDFRFAVKAGKKITHIQRLKDSAEEVIRFTEHVKEQLAEKLTHFLFQLPPSFHFSEENLERVITAIPGDAENVVEFRHISWWNEEVQEALGKAGLTFCNVDYPKLPLTFLTTSDRFYLRLHGNPLLFQSPYSNEQLNEIAARIPRDIKSASVYFNNTMSNEAWKNAGELIRQMLPKTQTHD